MVEPPAKMLREYAMPDASSTSASIVRPSVQANNFELKLALIHIVQQDQFGGSPAECPLEHLANFLEKCDTIKINGVSEDAIRLRLFSFSLSDKARKWLSSKLSDPFTTWTSLSQAFLNKFFPLAKTAKLCNDITNFTQNELESLYESWERFKDFLLVQTFYNGLNHSIRSTIHAAAGGALMSKTTEEANKLLEELAFNKYGCSSERSVAKKSTGMYDVDGINMLNAKVDNVTKIFSKMSNVSLISSPDLSCDNCGGAHASSDCLNFEQA
uniref:Retrotransposon gag domain-containing protein n=1 Tax=Chenopodium quinoa TaxID=63459 RepID=A0A803MXF6_CHEQI